MSEAIEDGFKEGDKVWVQDADGKHHPGIFVGNNEAAGWFGGGPSAYVAHPEAHHHPPRRVARTSVPRVSISALLVRRRGRGRLEGR
jgi:hypothetical protein